MEKEKKKELKIFQKNFKLNKGLVNILNRTKRKLKQFNLTKQKSVYKNLDKGGKKLIFMDIKTYKNLKQATDRLFASKLRYKHFLTKFQKKRKDDSIKNSTRSKSMDFIETDTTSTAKKRMQDFVEMFRITQRQKKTHMRLFENIFNNLEGMKINQFLPNSMKKTEPPNIKIDSQEKIVYIKTKKKKVPRVRSARASSARISSYKKKMRMKTMRDFMMKKRKFKMKKSNLNWRGRIKARTKPNNFCESQFVSARSSFNGRHSSTIY